ncbi:hypothetical protein GOODEAATRI_021623 [Goodea atripinnis]|uniref:Uncharacterized protein n=1 Tax=Goodea atripinnis TaxID=208336 RepID=A0ABV0MJQ6_9TELE
MLASTPTPDSSSHNLCYRFSLENTPVAQSFSTIPWCSVATCLPTLFRILPHLKPLPATLSVGIFHSYKDFPRILSLFSMSPFHNPLPNNFYQLLSSKNNILLSLQINLQQYSLPQPNHPNVLLRLCSQVQFGFQIS